MRCAVFGGGVELLIRPLSVAKDPIADLEQRNSFADLGDLACNVGAKDSWVFHPGVEKVTLDL